MTDGSLRHIVIVGGGASGLELAIAGLLRPSMARAAMKTEL